MRTRPLVLLTFGLLTACGGSTSTATPQTTAGATTTTVAKAATGAPAAGAQLTPEQQTAVQAYRTCLRDNGGLGNFGGGAGGRTPGQGGGQPPAGGQPPTGGQATPPVSIDPAVLAKAEATCKDKLPAGMDAATATAAGRGQRGQGQAGGQGQGQPGGFDPTVIQAYISCLTDNGVKIPTTSSTTTQAGQQQGGARGGLGGLGGLGNIDRNSPEFVAANAKCQVLLPNGQGFPGGGGRNGGQPGDQTAASTGPTTTKP